jgi:hypothetical protein
MAIIDIGVADGSLIGNPQIGSYFLFIDSNDSNIFKKRDSAGVDVPFEPAGTSSVVTGFFDYNDGGASVNIIGGNPAVNMENDEAGAFTNKVYKPTGVTDVWNKGTNLFDWSELNLGDTVEIRLTFKLTTTSVNTEIAVDLHLGTGAGSYTVPYVIEDNHKNTGTRTVNRFIGIYMGDLNTRDNGGVFKITADKNCSIVIEGWYVNIIKR